MLGSGSPGVPRAFRMKTGVAVLAALAAASLALTACSSGSNKSSGSTATGGSTPSTGGSSAPSESTAPSGGPGSAAPTYAPATVTFGTVPIAGSAVVAVAQAAGYFKDVNLTVNIEHASAINNVVPGVVGGTYNFGFQSGGGTAAAVAQGLPVGIITQSYFHVKEQEMMVKTGGPIKTLKDLKGKTIALGALNNNYEAGLIKDLEGVGLKKSDVTIITMPTNQIADAIISGRVAVGQINEPFIAENGDKLTTLFDPLEQFGTPAANAYFIVNTKWADDHKDLVTRFAQAINRAQVRAATDRAFTEKVITDFSGIKSDLVSKMNMPGFGPQLLLDSETQQQHLMFELGFLKKDLTAQDLLYKGIDVVALSEQAAKEMPSPAASSS